MVLDKGWLPGARVCWLQRLGWADSYGANHSSLPGPLPRSNGLVWGNSRFRVRKTKPVLRLLALVFDCTTDEAVYLWTFAVRVSDTRAIGALPP